MVPETEETLTTLRKTSTPCSRSCLAGSRRCGAAARITRNGTTVWMSSIRWYASSVILWIGASIVYPALLTMMSTLPQASTAACTRASGAPSLARSPPYTAVSPAISEADCAARSASRSLMTTFAPCALNSSAVARPMPRAEPVTIATLSSRTPMAVTIVGGPPIGGPPTIQLRIRGAQRERERLRVGPGAQRVVGADVLLEADRHGLVGRRRRPGGLREAHLQRGRERE